MDSTDIDDPMDYHDIDDVSDTEGGFTSDFTSAPQTPSTRHGSPPPTTPRGNSKIISIETSFDAYFQQHARPARTSTNIFSQLVPPLSADEYAAAFANSRNVELTLPNVGQLQKKMETVHKSQMPRFQRELDEGFHLIFYGFGSKRKMLNTLATEHCRKRGHVIVANAHRPQFSMKDLVSSIESIPGLTEMSLPASGLDGQIRRICEYFATPPSGKRKLVRPLYLIIHNLDAPPLRSSRARAQLGQLLASPRIHVAASIDHINAPLLFSSSDLTARRCASSSANPDALSAGAWLWHDLTTLAPYDHELAFADRSSIRGASVSSTSAAAAQTAASGPMTETAAQHVLAAVTQKAKKLFLLLANHQLDALAESAAGANADATTRNGAEAEQDAAIAYDRLFNLARDQFIATNDTALRALLGEFRDHGLVVAANSGTVGAGEMLWIPLRKERLKKLVDWLDAQ
ncbi:origin recognition complex subunit 2 [Dentipellis sp. KUC8613]|nr:origin recognition complex subunit 2 [Dentipellis sp. KUC8613]